MDNGLEREQDYPYTGRKGECKYNKEKVVVRVKKFELVEVGNPQCLKYGIAQGPVVVGVDSSSQIFQNYRAGIITSP